MMDIRQGRLGPRWVEDDESGCWVWQRATARHGYGLVSLRVGGRKTSQQAHRWVYERLVGPVSRGQDLDHLCRIHICVNPAHLEPVSHTVNVRRGAKPRLDEDKVRFIRRRAAAGDRYADIATALGVSKSAVGHVMAGNTWRDVELQGAR